MRWIATVLLLSVVLAGCSGVILNGEYKAMLDKTTALSAETAKAAQDGRLDEAQKTDALVKQAEVWQKFKDAAEGKK